MVAMIALCFCKFTLIYCFIYMNLWCSPCMGQELVARTQLNCHVLCIYLFIYLNILARASKSGTDVANVLYFKMEFYRSNLVTEALAHTHTHT